MPALLFMAMTSVLTVEFKVQESPAALNEIVATWKVSTLDDIREFELSRKMNSSDWVVVHKVQVTDAMVASGKKDFEYIDRDVYKSGANQAIAEYRLKVSGRNNVTLGVYDAQVSYTTSAVRRTWGSIKSMFQ